MRSIMITARGLAFAALSSPLFAADPHVADGPRESNTIYYVIGGVIVLAVVIFLLTRKKK